MKPLDLADKYDSTLGPDSEPTVKVHVPDFLPKVIVSEEEDDEVTIPDYKPPPIHEETRYPGIGLAIVLVTGGLFWGGLLWLLFGR